MTSVPLPATRGPVVLIVGTRPEAIKMAPVHRALTAAGHRPLLVSTGQHRELLASTLRSLELDTDHDLAVMSPGQTLNDVLARVVERLSPLLAKLDARSLVVQGDTTTALAAALTAYNMKIPVAHVEAGLRTYDHEHPYPEEGNRQLVDRLCKWCFTPTNLGRDNLLAERIDAKNIFVTGNTAVDSLLWMVERARPFGDEGFILMTLHRRESFGEPLRDILRGVRDFLESHADARVVWPLHPNPEVKKALDDVLGGKAMAQMRVIEPLEYDRFAGALRSCRFVMSDSGGVQEEAPSLGKRVLIARETTERPEGVDSGNNWLIGRTRTAIAEKMNAAWAEAPFNGALPAANPYGDGRASERIARALLT